MSGERSHAELRLPKRLTLQEAVQVLDQLNIAVSNQPDATMVALDAGALRVFDSSAVAVLLALRRNLLSKGKRLQVLHRPQRLNDLVTLYGVDELLPMSG